MRGSQLHATDARRTDHPRNPPFGLVFVLSRSRSLELSRPHSLKIFFAPRSCPPPQRGAHPRTEGRNCGPEGGEEGWVPVDPDALERRGSLFHHTICRRIYYS